MVKKIYGPKPNLSVGGKVKPVTVSKDNIDKLCNAIRLDNVINGISIEEGWSRPIKETSNETTRNSDLDEIMAGWDQSKNEEPVVAADDPLAEKLRKFING